MSNRAQNARDAALLRLSNVNQTLTIAAVVATAALVEVVSHIPFKHTQATSAAAANVTAAGSAAGAVSAAGSGSSAGSTAAGGSGSAGSTAAGANSSGSLSSAPPPASAPATSAPAAPVVISGGS